MIQRFVVSFLLLSSSMVSAFETRIIPVDSDLITVRLRFAQANVEGFIDEIKLRDVFDQISLGYDLSIDPALDLSTPVSFNFSGSRGEYLNKLGNQYSFSWFFDKGVLRVLKRTMAARPDRSDNGDTKQSVFFVEGLGIREISQIISERFGFVLYWSEELPGGTLSSPFFAEGTSIEIVNKFIAHLRGSTSLDVFFNQDSKIIALTAKNSFN